MQTQKNPSPRQVYFHRKAETTKSQILHVNREIEVVEGHLMQAARPADIVRLQTRLNGLDRRRKELQNELARHAYNGNLNR